MTVSCMECVRRHVSDLGPCRTHRVVGWLEWTAIVAGMLVVYAVASLVVAWWPGLLALGGAP